MEVKCISQDMDKPIKAFRSTNNLERSEKLKMSWWTNNLERSERLQGSWSTNNLEWSERLKGSGSTTYLERSERLKVSLSTNYLEKSERLNALVNQSRHLGQPMSSSEARCSIDKRHRTSWQQSFNFLSLCSKSQVEEGSVFFTLWMTVIRKITKPLQAFVKNAFCDKSKD